MTSRIDQLETAVRQMYEAKDPNRADWADYLFEDHVLVVADYASQLARKYGANEELARAGALLYDIADAVMPRNNPEHETKSLEIAHDLLTKNNYSPDEISLVVDDAIRYRSCRNGEQPASLESKILATADSFAHLKTDFYLYAIRAFAAAKTRTETKDWVLKKLDRDFHNKILLEDERAELQHDYDILKELFSR